MSKKEINILHKIDTFKNCVANAEVGSRVLQGSVIKLGVLYAELQVARRFAK